MPIEPPPESEEATEISIAVPRSRLADMTYIDRLRGHMERQFPRYSFSFGVIRPVDEDENDPQLAHLFDAEGFVVLPVLFKTSVSAKPVLKRPPEELLDEMRAAVRAFDDGGAAKLN